MNKEEIESLFKKYKVRIPKEKQGQSECYKCKENYKYSLTWTSFLYEYEEHYYCYEHILNILLQQENQRLKLDYELYKDNHSYKNYEVETKDNTIKQLKEVIEEVRECVNIENLEYASRSELINKIKELQNKLQILDKAKGEDNGK